MQKRIGDRRGRDRMVLDLQLPVQSVSITTKVVSSNPVHGDVYSMQHYVIMCISDLRQVRGFTRVLWFPQPIKQTATISLKYCRKWLGKFFVSRLVFFAKYPPLPNMIYMFNIFHTKPHFFKAFFQSQFLFDFDEIFTNKSENVFSFL